jgi:very-short-patch-repair endonuclease
MSKSQDTFEDDVVRLYNKEDKSTYEIADLLDTYPNKIRRILKKHGYELKNRSEAQKNALQNGRTEHPTKGKQRSYDEKLKISSKLCEYWDTIDEDEKERRINTAKENWANMTQSQREMISSLAIQAIQKAGKEGSKIEKFLHRKLVDLGYSVEFHKKNLIPNENLEIDLYIPSLKTIIEIDGPSHFLPVWGEEKLQKQIKADLDKNGLILSKGYVIIRLKALKAISFSERHNLVLQLKKILENISHTFPQRSKRYIEVDL